MVRLHFHPLPDAERTLLLASEFDGDMAALAPTMSQFERSVPTSR